MVYTRKLKKRSMKSKRRMSRRHGGMSTECSAVIKPELDKCRAQGFFTKNKIPQERCDSLERQWKSC